MGFTPFSKTRTNAKIQGWDLAPADPPLSQSHFASGYEGFTPSSQTRTNAKIQGWDLVPLRPTPDLIFFRLRQGGTHPVLVDSDGVGFETMCYYLIINTIKDLYCAVLREFATTCDFAVTNCHGIYFPHSQSEIIAKMPSPFEIRLNNPTVKQWLNPICIRRPLV